MPSDLKFVVALRGTEQYGAALTRLIQTARRKLGIQVATRNDLAEVALAELAARCGLKLPRRSRPHGANQYGEPKAV